MNWYQMRCQTTPEGIDIVSGYLLAQGITGVMIEDAADFTEFLEDTSVSWDWDYIDDDLLKMKQCQTAVIFYLPADMNGMEQLKAIKAGFPVLRAQNPAVDLGNQLEKILPPRPCRGAHRHLPLLGKGRGHTAGGGCAGPAGPGHGLRQRHP